MIKNNWYKDYKTSSKSLYHGTTLKNALSIARDGLIPGVGKFVSDAYSEYDELPELSFAADKDLLDKAVTAMRYQVALELGYDWLGDITNDELKHNGAIIVFKGDGGSSEPAESFMHRDENDKKWNDGHYSDEYPTVEHGDYFSENVETSSYILSGDKMYKFLIKNKAWPLNNDEMRKMILNNILSKRFYENILDKKYVLDEANQFVNNIKDQDIKYYYNKYCS